MSGYTTNETNTQNLLLMKNLMEFYKNHDNLVIMMRIINGESKISLRIVDWFVTNYAKNYYTVYEVDTAESCSRFKVYNEYKLKLKAYSKRQFDPFCRWERINIPFQTLKSPTESSEFMRNTEGSAKNQVFMETTIGQLNFFKWAIESNVLQYIEENYEDIEKDMNSRNSTSKKKQLNNSGSTVSSEDSEGVSGGGGGKTRKKREELSVFPCKCIKKESVRIVVKF